MGQIWKEILDQKLHVPPNQGKTPEQSCNARCQLMTRTGILGRDETMKPYQYYYIPGKEINLELEEGWVNLQEYFNT